MTRVDAGDRLLAAAIGGEDGDGGPGGAVALLKAVRDVIRDEGGVARPVRPHLVKALGANRAARLLAELTGAPRKAFYARAVALTDDDDAEGEE